MSEQIPSVVVMTQEQLTDMVQRTWHEAKQAQRLPEVMTQEECADLLRCHPRSVANWVRERGLPERAIGREKRYLRDEVMAWLDAQKVSA